MTKKLEKLPGDYTRCPKCRSRVLDVGVALTSKNLEYQCRRCGYGWQSGAVGTMTENAKGQLEVNINERAFRDLGKSQERFVNEFMESPMMKEIRKMMGEDV